MTEYVWIVSYFECEDREATVTAFSNEEAARSCYETFAKEKSHVALDKVPVCSTFTTWKELI